MRLLATVVCFLCLIFVAAGAFADSIEEEFNANKEWEHSIGVGYKTFSNNAVKDSLAVNLRFQKRVGYPFLLGIEGEGSFIGDVGYFRVGIPLSVRVPMPVEKTKLDLIVSPGGLYATNTNTKVKEIAAAGTGGVELKYFIKSGYSLGLGAYYTVTTNHLNNFNFMVVFGF